MRRISEGTELISLLRRTVRERALAKGESYRRQLRSLLLYLCYVHVFRALINFLVCCCMAKGSGFNMGGCEVSVRLQIDEADWKGCRQWGVQINRQAKSKGT